MNVHRFLLVVALLHAMITTKAYAVAYNFDSIAPELAVVPGSDEAPVILVDGSVLYLSDYQLMKGDGETSTVVYESEEDSDIPPYSVQDISFNANGDFVALCRAGSRQATLVLCENGKTQFIDRRPALSLGPAAINDSGAVAYAVSTGNRLTQILLREGNESRAIAQSHTLTGLKAYLPSLNNRGQVAVISRQGIYVIDTEGDQAIAGKIVSTSDGLGTFEGIRLNDAGQIGFRAKRPAVAIYLSDGDQLAKLADTTGQYAEISLPSLNNLGQVAFHSTLNDGTETIVAGNKGAITPVISTGDSLGDSTVTTLRFSNQGLNDAGQVAFWALLLDGTEGIYRATPIK